MYLPQCSEEDEKVASGHNVRLIEAEELIGFEPIDWLSSVPIDHHMDFVIGHGLPLGRQVQLIRRQTQCKWIQVVHTAPEELGMFKGICIFYFILLFFLIFLHIMLNVKYYNSL